MRRNRPPRWLAEGGLQRLPSAGYAGPSVLYWNGLAALVRWTSTWAPHGAWVSRWWTRASSSFTGSEPGTTRIDSFARASGTSTFGEPATLVMSGAGVRPAGGARPGRAAFVVNVMNATGKDGLGGRVAAGLAKQRFTVGGISNAPESWYVTQSAVVHHGPAGLDQALLVSSQIPGATLFEDARPGTGVDAVVRMGYADMVPVPARLRPIPSEVGVNVYNTTYRTGPAKVVARDLKARGFDIKDVSNGPQRTCRWALPSSATATRVTWPRPC